MDKGDTVNVEKPIGSGEEGCLPVLPESSSTVRDNERIQHEQEEKRARLVFKYLREKKPLPSKTRQRWIVVALYAIMALAGWDSAASAPLLPFLQRYYGINYLIMSMIFITTFIGGLISAALNVYVTDRFGFGIVSGLGTVSFAVGYIISSTGCPYPLFAIAFVFNGLGFGFQDAQLNTLTARLPNPNAKMALLHSFFGLGGTVAPFISTPFVQHFPNKPYLLYVICLGVALSILAIEVVVFRGQTEEQLTGRIEGEEKKVSTDVVMPLAEMGHNEAHISTAPEEARETEANMVEGGGGSSGKMLSSGTKMRMIVTTPAIYVFIVYSFLYVGMEVTIASWAPTYLIQVRGADSNAGYVTSGFWGALTIGRVILIPVTARLGNRWSVFVYSGFALAFQLVVWLVDSYICSAVCICMIGFFLAPIFPAAIVLVTEIIPEELHVGVIGIFGTIGGAGAAATPFILGAMADEFGFWVMGPTMTAFIGASIVLWAFVPRRKIQI